MIARRSLSGLLILMAVGILQAGCSRGQEGAMGTAQPTVQQSPANSSGRKGQSAAAPDMTDYPAPSGVKTGVGPGGRK